MTLYVHNRNSVIIRNLRSVPNSEEVEALDLKGSLLKQNEFVITDVNSHATEPLVTFTEDVSAYFSIGDRVHINRLLGTKSLNGFTDIVAVDGKTITVQGDTSSEIYEDGPSSCRIVLVEEQDFVKTENTYVCTFSEDVDLDSGQKYIVFLASDSIGMEQEKLEIAQVRS